MDILSTATDSMSPTFEPDWLEPGMYVAMLGPCEISAQAEGFSGFPGDKYPGLFAFFAVPMLTASFFSGIASNPAVPNDLTSKAQTELTSGVPFISDADLQQALDDAGVAPKTADAVVAENADSRIAALRVTLSA